MLSRHGVVTAETSESRKHLAVLRTLLGILIGTTVVYSLTIAGFLDLHIYRAGAGAFLAGTDLYSAEFSDGLADIDLPFLYPPLAAIAFVPMYLVPWHVAKVLLMLASMAAILATALVVTWRSRGRDVKATIAAVALAAAWVAFEPVRKTVDFGQINLILMSIVALDCLLPRTKWPRGLLVGIGAAIKLTPAVFVLFFLAKRQYRAAGVAVGSFLVLSLAGFALAPRDSAGYWFGFLFETDKGVGVAYAFNQSINGILSRLITDDQVRAGCWLLLVLAAFVLTLFAMRQSRRRGDDVLLLLAIAAFGLLASPISWSHHWVWIIPGAAALAHIVYRSLAAGRWAAAALATVPIFIFAIGPHTLLPSGRFAEMSWSWRQHLLGSSYVLVALGMLIVLAGARRPTRTAKQLT